MIEVIEFVIIIVIPNTKLINPKVIYFMNMHFNKQFIL